VSTAAEKLIAAFNDHQRNSVSFDVLLRRFSYKFPRSRIPKDRYHFLLGTPTSDDSEADDFLVDHIQRFHLGSSLTEIVESKRKGRRWEIWRRVFSFSKNTPEVLDRLSNPQQVISADRHLKIRDFHDRAEDLAQQIREGCVDRREMGNLVEMWQTFLLDTAEQPVPLWRKEFWEIQLALCFLALGENDTLLRILREGTKFAIGFGYHSIGRSLALKKATGVLAECWTAIPSRVYRYEFLEGVTDGFKKAGDVSGLILIAKQLGTIEKMQDMMNMMESIWIKYQ
jgi:hypothetical protein